MESLAVPAIVMAIISIVLMLLPIVFLLLFLALFLAALGFWLWMLVDCLTKEPPGEASDNAKLLWILVLIFTHAIGALLYFFIRRPERKRKYGK